MYLSDSLRLSHFLEDTYVRKCSTLIHWLFVVRLPCCCWQRVTWIVCGHWNGGEVYFSLVWVVIVVGARHCPWVKLCPVVIRGLWLWWWVIAVIVACCPLLFEWWWWWALITVHGWWALVARCCSWVVVVVMRSRHHWWRVMVDGFEVAVGPRQYWMKHMMEWPKLLNYPSTVLGIFLVLSKGCVHLFRHLLLRGKECEKM